MDQTIMPNIGLTLKTLRKKECRDLYFVTIYLYIDTSAYITCV